MSYYEMERFFKTNAELAYRDEKGLVKDQIYLGCMSKRLEENFTKKQIETAIKEGWLKRSYIQKEGELRSIYAWLEHRLQQRRPVQSFFEKISTFFQEKVIGP